MTHPTTLHRNALARIAAVMALVSFVPLSLNADEAAPAKPATPPMQVSMDTVKTEPLRQTVPVIGRFVPLHAGVVAARVSGPVAEYLVRVGDSVEKGETLARLVNDTFMWEVDRRKADVADARAQIETSRATLKLLEQELGRLDGLRNSPAFNQARLDDKAQETVRAKSGVSEASARLLAAQAELKLAEIDFANTTIAAPYAGVVTERHSEAGAYLRVGDPVLTMLDHKNLEIEADVPANRISGLDEGRHLVATMVDGSELTAIVRAVIPDENPRTRTRRVRFTSEFPGANKSTAANQTVTVLVPAGEVKTVLTVHKDAVLNRGGGQLVVLNDNGKATFRPVTLGQAVGQRFVVDDGLKEGDEVVIRGNERLRPGQAIARSNVKDSAS